MPGTDAETARGSGYVVLTPLRLADGTRVLVNRGWVERQYKDPRTRAAAQVTRP
jgi:surfeit locus 1 family protein